MENFNDVTQAFEGLTQRVAVTRRGVGEYTDGVWVPGDDSTVYITAVVQNTSPKDMELVSENIRTESSIKLHTSDYLRTADEVGANNADLINYKGKLWLVHIIFDRPIGGYIKAIGIEQ